ncbi:MAG: Gfo/Idh/MocA family oxidoreductase [Pseudomonadota bacterium]
MSATLRVLQIGAGYFARFHFEAWHAAPETEVVALADLDRTKAAAMVDDVAGPERGIAHGIAIGEDAAALIAAHAPDIVDIASPPASHLAMIEAAYAAPTTRAVICQKPFCGGLEGGRRAAALAAEDGRPLVVHENFRFQPWYREIKRLMDAGTIGDLYQMAFILRPGDGQGPKAYLSRQPYFQRMPRFLVHETAVHWIDTFRYLMGPAEAVYADLQRLNPAIAGEDAGHILFSWADGRRALFDGNRLADHPAENPRLTMGEARLDGSEGGLFLDGYGDVWHRARGSGFWQPRRAPYAKAGFGGGCVAALQAHVVAHLQDGAPLENTAADYLWVQEVEEAVYRAAAEGRRVQL